MNIDNLTIAQAREIAAIFGAANAVKTPVPFIGRHVICRCYSAGVHAGELVSLDGDVAVLKNARRLWQWKAKEGVALSGVAVHGLASSGNKLDVMLPEMLLTGVIEVIPTSDAARASINDQ